MIVLVRVGGRRGRGWTWLEAVLYFAELAPANANAYRWPNRGPKHGAITLASRGL